MQAQDAADGLGMAVYRTESGEVVMAACYLVPYAAEDVAALRLVTSLTLIERQIQNAFCQSRGGGGHSGVQRVDRACILCAASWCRWAGGAHCRDIARGEFDVRLPVSGDDRDEVDRLRGTINRMAEGWKRPRR